MNGLRLPLAVPARFSVWVPDALHPFAPGTRCSSPDQGRWKRTVRGGKASALPAIPAIPWCNASLRQCLSKRSVWSNPSASIHDTWEKDALLGYPLHKKTPPVPRVATLLGKGGAFFDEDGCIDSRLKLRTLQSQNFECYFSMNM